MATGIWYLQRILSKLTTLMPISIMSFVIRRVAEIILAIIMVTQNSLS